jgi:hypothetical protein
VKPPAGYVDRDGVADRIALRDLVDAYGVALDSRDPDLYASLWHDGAVFASHFPAGRPLRVPGLGEEHGYPEGQRTAPAGMQEAITGLAARFDQTLHFVGNHRVVLDGDRATGVTYSLAHHLRRANGATVDWILACTYDDLYRRTGDAWRFDRRDVHVLWTLEVRVSA